MTRPLVELLEIKVPIAVVLAERTLTLGQVLALVPGAVLEFGKPVTAPLDVRLHARRLAVGRAVRIGDRFALEVTEMGDARAAVEGLGQ